MKLNLKIVIYLSIKSNINVFNSATLMFRKSAVDIGGYNPNMKW